MIITIDANILIALFEDDAFKFGFKQFCKLYSVDQIIIPTPALCEFLSHDNADRFIFVQGFKRKTVSIGFDDKAAYLTAKLAEKYYSDRLEKDKQKVKVDLQILGIAIANGSQFILTKDGDFKDYISKLKLSIGIKSVADLYIKDELFKN
ncbi:PIN domain-containing protein [Acinetobacter cumulans]|uniref:PIN domain-containing protein n=1 Tax=Acinetobacter cumulans TaxID=2136182 RepID=UPI001443F077|nr:PIN domain-containing protein [Acinetobacter cumulans]